MIYKNLTHKSLLLLVTCLTSICILTFGMRGPDLSRPNRPKPKPRAYIEEQFKKSQESVAKKSLDHCQAELPPSCEPVHHATFATGHCFAMQCVATSPLFSELSRAPPAPAA
ncbi:hypothetical protein M1B72_20435 [Geomonas paludis]|uniref:Uncharacterized protein n=1 Tax=Geomonas paludis TaxID=2740185 RepID=A0A6V8MTA3_9BACT|nr:hypothetical protein [Geomonas paludis]UPU35781.1 hypothetical protein M1B72_20435 [Geomonas paludis]GFO62639.1 hypothetical protein GMPD_05580 [Geomonas paludis]